MSFDGQVGASQGAGPCRLLTVLDIPPLADYPNGWSGRYAKLLPQLARHFDLTVIYLSRGNDEGIVDRVIKTVQGYGRIVVIPIPQPRLEQPGIRGALARHRHYLFSRLPLPNLCHAPPKAAITEQVNSYHCEVIVVFLPWLAHLASGIDSGRVVLFMEERWDRSTAAISGSLRQDWVHRSERRRFERTFRSASERADEVIVISQLEKDQFRQLITPEKLYVLDHGIDVKWFTPITVESYEFDAVTFGYGSLDDDGHLLRQVIAEVARVNGGSTEIRWGLAGTRQLSTFADVLGVRCLGFVNDIRDLVASSKVVVVPSRHGSGVKTTVLEAWALQRPVVATPHAVRGLPAENGHNVLIGESPVELARLVLTLTDNPELRDRIAAAGRATVVQHRNIDQIAERFASRMAEECLADASTIRGNRASGETPSAS